LPLRSKRRKRRINERSNNKNNSNAATPEIVPIHVSVLFSFVYSSEIAI
jgi:hypothetical protein